MQKFRASYSVLSLWQSGRWEDAINAYFKLEEFATPQMEAGKSLHAEWEKETTATNCLPAIFGGQKLTKPQSELKLVVELEPWLDLVGVIDCYDSPDVHEFKSGVKSSQQYANDKQIGVYAVICILSDMPAKRLFIHHWNQYTKQADTSMVWVTEQLLKDTVAWVETTASEMHNYFIENQLYERFGKNK